jgi:uncharacterized protein (DUF1697 family)
MDPTYVALLRGINVGGRNRIRMVDLVACFEAAGYRDVRTLIQGGNVVFRADRADLAGLTGVIEQMLADAFDYSATIVLRDHEAIRAVVDAPPAGFGGDPDDYRYDVFFLMPPLTPAEVLDALTIKEGVDAAWPDRAWPDFDARDSRQLARAVAAAVSAPYRVLDADGNKVAAGTVGGTPVKVPAGASNVVVLADPTVRLDAVEVSPGKRASLTLPDAEG